MKKIKHKRLVIIFAVLAGLMLLATLFSWWNSPEQIYARNKKVLEKAALTIQETGNTRDIDIGGVNNIAYLSEAEAEHPVVEFYTSSFGVMPPAPYVGLYYSVDGYPVADESGANLIADGDIWRWVGTGDNRGTTWLIEGNWYAYTAWY
ncbi:MAG: hypothetical protein LUI10_13960 [Lachnospiraceae bacterium]|nr:hypothetical protein [Lachnospiraceae bacterium]